MSRARSPSPLLDVKEPLCKEDKEDKDTSPNVVAVEPSLPGEVVLSLCRSQSLARDPSVRGDEPVDILTPAPNEQDFGPPPDGGTEAWRVVAASLLLLFAVFGLMNATGQLLAFYLDNQLKGYSPSTVSWIGSVQTFVEFSFAMATGRWFDNHGARTLNIIGLVLANASIVALAFCYEFYQFFLGMALFGFAGSMVFAPANAVAAHWFLRYRSTAIAIISGGAGLGGIIYPIMIERLLGQFGYRNTMLTLAGFNFMLMLPSVFFMKARLPPRAPPPLSYLKRPWKEPRYCFLVAASALYAMNILSPFLHGIAYAKANGVPEHISTYAIAIMGSGSVVGRLVMGMLGDRYGVWRMFTIVPFATAISIFAFWVPPNIGTGPTIVGLLLYGWMSGGFFSLMGSATASFSPLAEVGTRIGLLISSFAIPSFVGPVITGALVKPDKFMYAGLWIGCCQLVSGLLLNAPAEYAWVRRQLGYGAGDKDSPDVEMSPQLNPSQDLPPKATTVS